MPEVVDLIARHCKKGFAFACVYTDEAHAQDEWPISEAPVSIPSHKSLKEREDAANVLIDHFDDKLPFDIYLDDMDNSFNSAYSSWPFRFWVMTKQCVEFKAMPREAAYHLEDLDDFLSGYSAKTD